MRTRIIGIVIVCVTALAVIGGAVWFIWFPTVTQHKSEITCYNCTTYNIPLDEKQFEDMESISVSYDVTVTKHWWWTTLVEGTVDIDGHKMTSVHWDKTDGKYCLFVTDDPDYSINGESTTVTFNSDFTALSVFYNNVDSSSDEKFLWVGPANSADQLVNAISIVR